MAGDRNHYEKAFSGWLVASGLQSMGIDERARPRLPGRDLKNFDFLVNGAQAVYALDLKGRRGTPWITQDDLFSLMAWRRVARGALEPALVFAFYMPGLPGTELPARFHNLPALRLDLTTGIYLFSSLSLESAQRLARRRSRRWNTYGFEWAAFCKAARPVNELLLGTNQGPTAAAAGDTARETAAETTGAASR